MPPLGEQRAIADYLDTETARIDALITKKRRLITLLEERRELALVPSVLVRLGAVNARDRRSPKKLWLRVVHGHPGYLDGVVAQLSVRPCDV